MRPRRVLRLLLLFLVALFGLAVIVVVYEGIADGEWEGSGLIAIGAGVYFWVLYGFILPWKARRNFRLQKSVHAPFSIETLEDAFVGEGANGNMRMPWGDFHKWKANDKLILLYQAPNLYNMIPRRACPTDEEWAALLTFIKAKMGPQRV